MRVTTPDGTVHDINFGWLSVSGTGSNIHYVRFKFNQSAKVEWVQQLIRSLTYKNSGEISGDRKLALTIEDVGGRMTAMEVVIKSTEPQPDVNKLPAGLTLSNDAILENSEAGTTIGTLRATDEDGTPLTYTLTGTAEGRFEIRGDKLVVKDGSKIDFENASSHTITVKVSDGKAAVTKDFTIAVTDVREDVPGATRAKNALVGGIGADKINGGSGNDVLTGGLGADVFVFDTALGRGTTARNHNKKVNFDTIVDFKPGEDKIWLDNKIFTKLGRAGSEAAPAALNKKFFKTSKATDKDDYLVYKSGVVYYDQDGKGTKYKPVEIIKIANKVALSAADFLVI
jgi:Ca2+-binding RTX toxin-like protein